MRISILIPAMVVVVGVGLLLMALRSPAPPAQVEEEEVVATASSIGKAEFPHLEHVDDFGLECADCHHETNAGPLNIPHEKYFEDFWIDCKTCHHPSGEIVQEPMACSECHPDQPQHIADETLSSKVVIHKSCWECHDSGTGVEAAENCGECHTGPPSESF